MVTTIQSIFAQADEALENGQGHITDYSQPVWTPTLIVDNGAGGSLYPALFAGEQQSPALAVNVQIGAEWQNIGIHLVAQFNGFDVFRTGSSGGAVGAWSAQATALTDTPTLATIAGDVSWYIFPDQVGDPTGLVVTRLELTWIYAALPNFFSNLAYAAVLRGIFSQIDPTQHQAGVVEQITQYCFDGFAKQYDTTAGRSNFGCSPSGGVFQLAKYLVTSSPQILNCYDQAGFVQLMIGTVGLQGQWLYMNPYGYISQTDLIGRGQCNNPFYAANNSPMIVAPDSPARTAFGNHAFFYYGNGVLDACAGPHTGAESPAAYLAAAIDLTSPPSTQQNTGTLNNIASQEGLTSLTMNNPPAKAPAYGPGMALLFGAEDHIRGAMTDPGARPDWMLLTSALQRTYDLTLANRDVIPGADDLLVNWLWRRGAALVDVRVVRAKDPDAAFSSLLAYLDTFQNDPASCLQRDPEFGAAGLRSAAADLVMFVRSDFFVTVSASDAIAVARKIDAAIRGAAIMDGRAGTRPMETLTLTIGERIRIDCHAGDIFELAGRAARIAGRGDGYLDLAGREGGVAELRVARVDDVTLDVETRVIQIVVGG